MRAQDSTVAVGDVITTAKSAVTGTVVETDDHPSVDHIRVCIQRHDDGTLKWTTHKG